MKPIALWPARTRQDESKHTHTQDGAWADQSVNVRQRCTDR
jgi:hypothetical protein